MQRLLLLLFSLMMLSGCTTFTQIRLDAEVNRRCREDAGLKIYETVPTAPENFSKYGKPKFFHMKQGENALGPEYKFIYKNTFYHGGYVRVSYGEVLGSPSVWKTHIQVLRRADNKLLGQSISYSRYGGDPGWATTLTPGVPESSYDCPEKDIGEWLLVEKIFINTAKSQP